MGMLDGIMGNASEVDVKDVAAEFAELLVEGEQIERAFRLVRDMLLFTNKRFVIVDKQGMSGKKVEYHSIPYQSIRHFSIETAGTLDRDAELKIWLAGMGAPIQKQLKKGMDIVGVQRTLAAYVLR
jgi:hypothetical protein